MTRGKVALGPIKPLKVPELIGLFKVMFPVVSAIDIDEVPSFALIFVAFMSTAFNPAELVTSPVESDTTKAAVRHSLLSSSLLRLSF